MLSVGASILADSEANRKELCGLNPFILSRLHEAVCRAAPAAQSGLQGLKPRCLTFNFWQIVKFSPFTANCQMPFCNPGPRRSFSHLLSTR